MLPSATRPGSMLPPMRICPSGCGCDCLIDATSNAGAPPDLVPVWAANAYTERNAFVKMRILVLRRFFCLVHDQHVDRGLAGIELEAELLHGREDRPGRIGFAVSMTLSAACLTHHHHGAACHGSFHPYQVFHRHFEVDVVLTLDVGHVNHRTIQHAPQGVAETAECRSLKLHVGGPALPDSHHHGSRAWRGATRSTAWSPGSRPEAARRPSTEVDLRSIRRRKHLILRVLLGRSQFRSTLADDQSVDG